MKDLRDLQGLRMHDVQAIGDVGVTRGTRHQVLGVEKTADTPAIKRAYKRLVHPLSSPRPSALHPTPYTLHPKP